MSKTREGDIYIPSETIVEEETRGLPFAYLRSWLAGLLALLLIPLGITLLLVGLIREDRLRQDWVETEAEIVNVTDGRLIYTWDAAGTAQQNAISMDWLQDASATVDGSTVITLDLCSLAARTFLPSEPGETLTIWYNPDNPKQSDCLPVTAESSPIYSALGGGALLVAVWLLLRIFHKAAAQSALKRTG
jgi:hypothetical protein